MLLTNIVMSKFAETGVDILLNLISLQFIKAIKNIALRKLFYLFNYSTYDEHPLGSKYYIVLSVGDAVVDINL